MYLTYAEYQAYGGTLEEATFNDFEMEAETVVDWYTFNRLRNDSTYPEQLKRCVYQLIKMAQAQQSVLAPGEAVTDDGGTGSVAVSSRSNDGVSVSYNVMSANELFSTLKTESKNIVQRYLQGVMNQAGKHLLYRGIYAGE